MGKVHKAQNDIAKATDAARKAMAEGGKGSQAYRDAIVDVEIAQGKLDKAMVGTIPPLTAAQKSQATYSLILKDTKDAQGDFARTSDSAANAQRVQAAETENLTAALGQGLLPYYQAGLQLLIRLTKATAGHTGAVKVLVGIVAGLSAAILVANAAMKAWTVVTGVAKVATIAWTAAQRLLNFALASNPIGLVIVAVAALAAGLVIAYKRSETFRNIVNAALNSVAAAAGALARAFGHVVDAARSAFNWIVDHWRLAAFALGPLGAGIVLLATHFDKVKAAGVAAFSAIKSVVDSLERAIGAVVNAVKDLIGWLGKIKVPKINLPHIPGTKAYGYDYGVPAPAGRAVLAGGGGVTVNFYGPTDPEGAARAIARVLRSHEARQGRRPLV
jgi:hypothetical protein